MRTIVTTVGTKNWKTREQWLEKTLKKIPSGARILDAGAGEQKYKRFCPNLNYVAQDFAEYDGKGDGRGLQKGKWDQSELDIVSDISAIPEPDSSFDAIMCVEVLEHLADPISAIREFSRLLKPGGQLVLTAPFCSLTHFSPYHFFTGFNRYFYENNLKRFGLDILELVANGNYFEYLAQEIRRISSIASQYCNTSPRKYELVAMKIILRMLQRFTGKDTGSKELLCFGYLVLASKSVDSPNEIATNDYSDV